MNFQTASTVIGDFDLLRQNVYLLAVANEGELMGEDAWLVGALGLGDMQIFATEDGIRCFGLTWTGQTHDNESFDFTIPYDRLGG